MKKTVSYALFLIAGIIRLVAQPAPQPYGVLPSERQLQWQEMEMYCIIHFGMATYTDKEWGYGDEDPSFFTASSFSAEQIVNAVSAGGFRGIVVVAKHHDGFCLWPTTTTSHNISESRWKNGKGDMVKEYQIACQKAGLKMGIYCSPWDRNNGLYGKPEYVTNVYRRQLKELYSGYGPFFISWHDGANGGDGYYGGAREIREIDRTTYYGWDSTWAITRGMQPGAVIFGDIGPDVRWVGNEEGHAGETCWATYTPRAPEAGKLPANGFSKYEEATEGTRNGKYWLPAECDVPLRPGWFYHVAQDGQAKSPHQLMDLYYKSVGRGACLDLGLSPDKRGLISEYDCRVLKEFGDLLRQTFSVNLAKDATFKASNIRGGNQTKFGPSFLVDNDRYSYWATDDSVTRPELIVTLPAVKTFNIIRLRENIKLGQRIEGVVVDAFLHGVWKEIGRVTSIGANRLIRLPQDISTDQLRVSVISSPVCITLSDFALFLEPKQLVAPVIQRNRSGVVTITGNTAGRIHYTFDGSRPSEVSPVYTKPFSLAAGGTVKAVLLGNKAEFSEITTEIYGFNKKDWKILGTRPTGIGNPDKMIDENKESFWSSLSKSDTSVSVFPPEVVVDMGTVHMIRAFTYLPRQDKKQEGIVDSYRFMVSKDNRIWKVAAEGEFANIAANPLEQVVLLKQPIEGIRYIKFIAKHTIGNHGMTVAELGCR